MMRRRVQVQNHAPRLLETLYGQGNAPCDIVLKVKDEQSREKHFPAHRHVLSACSEYFRGMFRSEMQEQASEEVTLKDMTATAVERVLEYTYTGEISLSEDNVLDMLQVASRWLFTDLLEVIDNYLAERVCTSTCLNYREWSKMFYLESLRKKVEDCMFENFEKVASQEEFCNLDESDVALCLSSDDLEVESENNVFDALVRWINKSPGDRTRLFPSLFKHVRLQHVSQEFLSSNVKNQPLVKQFGECLDLVEDAHEFHKKPSLFEAQRPRNWKVIFSPSEQVNVESLEFTSKGLDVKQILKPNFNVYFTHAIAKSNREVYLCGSADRIEESSVISFDGQNFKREGNTNSGNLSEKTVFCIANCLYVGGGDIDQGMEKYRLRPSFKFIETILFQPKLPRWTCSVVVGSDAYVIGGIDENDAHSTVKSFNAATNMWTNKPNMNQARYMCGAAVVRSKIFVCGGFSLRDDGFVNSLEYLDVSQNVWTMVDMHGSITFGATSVCTVGQELYVAGKSCNELWKYDTKLQAWNQDQNYGNIYVSFKIFSLK